ncbi:MAG: DL-endopeptidase inhibitor IseA family protein [Bacilli bacterium]|nr:DL-endopeptidase inhibitor IseA family protein [Bacilli bacterium]MDD4808676.1 DL-endopeptidase inhibitor IseA family protein [Bacilli bacterium]
MKKKIIIISVFTLLCGGIIFYIANKEDDKLKKILDKNTLPSGQVIDTTDEKSNEDVFDKTYNLTLEMASKIMIGTDWLNNSQKCLNDEKKVIDGKTYIKSCDENYNTYEKVTTYLNTIFTPNFTKTFLEENNYKDIDGELYYLPTNKTTNAAYKNYDSYQVILDSDNYITYYVKSAYNDTDCKTDCKDIYKEHYFSVEKIDNHWYASEFEMPY